MKLSKRDARKIFLKQQGLLKKDTFGRGTNATLEAIKRLSYIQIDTISVVSRAQDHVLQSRITKFEPCMLNKLMLQRSIYEYWSHAAAYLPFNNFRYSLPLMHGFRGSKTTDRNLANNVLARIRDEGPLRSKDFESPKGFRSGGWSKWKPTKKVLQHLFLAGELMVSHRQRFQKVFDLPENIIPSDVDTSEPNLREWSTFIVRSMADALGLASEYDLAYAKGTVRRLAKIEIGEPIREAIKTSCEEGELIEISVDGRPYYCRPSMLELLPVRAPKNKIKLLSPFDNLIINRRRTLELFDFDYQIECYLPAQKRRDGYFSLPILYGDALIGRVDSKAHRKAEELEVKCIILDVKPDDKLVNALRSGLRDFANKLKCPKIKIGRTEPRPLKQLLKE